MEDNMALNNVSEFNIRIADIISENRYNPAGFLNALEENRDDIAAYAEQNPTVYGQGLLALTAASLAIGDTANNGLYQAVKMLPEAQGEQAATLAEIHGSRGYRHNILIGGQGGVAGQGSSETTDYIGMWVDEITKANKFSRNDEVVVSTSEAQAERRENLLAFLNRNDVNRSELIDSAIGQALIRDGQVYVEGVGTLAAPTSANSNTPFVALHFTVATKGTFGFGFENSGGPWEPGTTIEEMEAQGLITTVTTRQQRDLGAEVVRERINKELREGEPDTLILDLVNEAVTVYEDELNRDQQTLSDSERSELYEVAFSVGAQRLRETGRYTDSNSEEWALDSPGAYNKLKYDLANAWLGNRDMPAGFDQVNTGEVTMTFRGTGDADLCLQIL
jgi:hypothetical protein